MKIVIDSAIPFFSGLFEPYAEVIYLRGSDFTAEVVRDADALIVRTRTRCDAALLEGSSVRLIATATIGYDHIDLDYCHQHNIAVTTAAGCNARGVLQWVSAGLATLSKREKWLPQERTIGIVGVGNVGELVAKYCHHWGFKVLCCDPPRAAKGEEGFISIEELLPQVDIVTLHTPLDESTHHLLNDERLKLLRPTATIINTSRGEVVDSAAILTHTEHPLLFDVWEGEPDINRTLLERAIVSTPHIAGYSLQGKANGSAMVVESVARFFQLPIKGWYPNVRGNNGAMIEWEQMRNSISQYIDIEQESRQLKLSPEAFESLRNNYNYREEYF